MGGTREMGIDGGDADGTRGNKDRIIVDANTHGLTVDIEICVVMEL